MGTGAECWKVGCDVGGGRGKVQFLEVLAATNVGRSSGRGKSGVGKGRSFMFMVNTGRHRGARSEHRVGIVIWQSLGRRDIN